MNRNSWQMWGIVVILFILNGAVWATQIPKAKKDLHVAYLNIGQGDAIYIEAPNGRQMLIDGGRGNQVIGELSKQMSFFDKTIDVVIGSHPDADHIGGLVDVLNLYKVGAFIEPGSNTDTKIYKVLEDKIAEQKIPHIAAMKGMKVMLDEKENVYVDIIFPDQDVSSWETNASSVVARLVYGDTSYLFTGDSPIAIEDYLVGKYKTELKSDILKLGHHGSRTSSGNKYLETVAPILGIISAGKGNTYGHPHAEVLDRLANHGIKYLSTIDNGTIEIDSNGEVFTIK